MKMWKSILLLVALSRRFNYPGRLHPNNLRIVSLATVIVGGVTAESLLLRPVRSKK
jgi:hypothetical protein